MDPLVASPEDITTTKRKETKEKERPWVCYVIEHVGCGATYVGVSPDPKRRLRQHNGEIKGGAKYTTSRPRGAEGEGCWRHVCLVHGFRTSIEALQFEWAVKHCPPRKSGAGGIAPRLKKLHATLSRPRWTSKAPPSSDVPLVLEWRAVSLESSHKRRAAFDALGPLPPHVSVETETLTPTLTPTPIPTLTFADAVADTCSQSTTQTTVAT